MSYLTILVKDGCDIEWCKKQTDPNRWRIWSNIHYYNDSPNNNKQKHQRIRLRKDNLTNEV